MTDYDIIASHFSHTRKYVWEDLKIFLDKIKKGSHVLDLGCGNGRILSLLADKEIKYLGIDKSSKILAEAKKTYPKHKFIKSDIREDNTFININNFDYVCLFAVLHHVSDVRDIKKIFSNISKVLKQDGYLFITVWNMYQSKYKDKIKNRMVTIPYHLSDGRKIINTENRIIRAFLPDELIEYAAMPCLKVKKYWYLKKGKIANREKGYNLCLSLQKCLTP